MSTSTSAAASPSCRSATAIPPHWRPRSAQLERLWHVSNLYRTEPAEQLAAALSDRFGGAQSFFCNSGAEAIEAAVKYARKATGKPGVVALEGGFHGRTFGALSVTGQPAKRAPFAPLVPGDPLRFAERRRRADRGRRRRGWPDPPRADPRRGRRRAARPRVRRSGSRALAAPLLRRGADRRRADRARSSRSSSSACARTSSRSRRVSPTDCPSGRCSSRTMRPAPSLPAITARRSAGTPCRQPRPPRSSRRSTTSSSRTCEQEVQSSSRASLRCPVSRVCAAAGSSSASRRPRPLPTSWRPRANEGLLVLSAGEHVVRLAPPLTVTADEVAAALDVLARVVTLAA